jgi:ribosome-binding factor A
MFPGEGAEEALQSISEKAGMFRKEMGKRLRNQLRHIPEFTFFLDDSLDYIDRIDNLLTD